MEAQIDRLTAKTWTSFRALPASERLMIAISGMAGSGKSTLAAAVVQKINALHRASGALGGADIATTVPMDGFHLTRQRLSAMSDPVMAHARRGAAFTLDPQGFLELVKELRRPLDDKARIVYAPSFDHAVKDPIPKAITLGPELRVVICEGLYLSLGTGAPEWKAAAELMDELWFIEVDEDVARKRVITRHLDMGISATEAEAAKRTEENDIVNGREIVSGRLPVHEIIQSVEV